MHEAASTLSSGGIENPRLDADVLARHLLSIDRTSLLLNLDRQLDEAELRAYQSLVSRRLGREPCSYITGRREFYLFDLEVSPAVMVPRPETELLVERALQHLARLPQLSVPVADIGTGCGAIAITIAANMPHARIHATDISEHVLPVARANCERHGVAERVNPLLGDLMEPVPEPVSLIVANLPYVRSADMPDLPDEARLYEPSMALDGGPDGLRVIDQMLSHARDKLLGKGTIVFEIGYDQGRDAEALARAYFPNSAVTVIRDLSNMDRMVEIQTPG